MSGKRRYKVTIDNETYTLVGNKSQEHVRVAQDVVNEQLRHIKSVSPELSKIDCAILLAFNTVSKQINQEQEIDRLNRKIQKLTVENDYLKHPEKALIHGNSDVQLDSDDPLQPFVGVQNSLFDTKDSEIPAIHQKNLKQTLER